MLLASRAPRVVRLAPLGLQQLRALSTPSYTDRMDKTGRPVSPHLMIYKFPAAAISSITTRITGVLLTVGTGGIGAAALAGADIPALVTAFQLGAPALVPLAKVVVAYPLSYHWLSALRHTVSPRLRRWRSPLHPRTRYSSPGGAYVTS
jgi:succinate dehydrogenase cytochrome b556 subunit